MYNKIDHLPPGGGGGAPGIPGGGGGGGPPPPILGGGGGAGAIEGGGGTGEEITLMPSDLSFSSSVLLLVNLPLLSCNCEHEIKTKN